MYSLTTLYVVSEYICWYVALYCSCQHFTKSVRFLTQVGFLGNQLHVVLKSLLSGTSLCFIEHLLRSLFQNNELTARWWSRFHMSREWALYGQVGGKRSWCKCEVVPVISNRGSQWGSATDSYESGSAASNGAVLLFGNAYYKCHLSALPGTHATTVLPPDGSWREAWLSYLHMRQQWPYMENQHRVTNARPL